ncbi:MAG: hypothetical protein KGK11_12230 [Sphingomonadales bacterium]|nr:hypothetical protein [Sphingomonadales bacterium]
MPSSRPRATPAAPASDRRVAVLVLGMHRSGTSAMARVMSLIGCALPRHLMPPGPHNPTGHWESEAVFYFNEELLAALDSRWDDWRGLDAERLAAVAGEAFLERARALLREEFAGARCFVFKDPRHCRLLPFWLAVLAAEAIEPRVVIVLRHPGEVAQSLADRDGIAPELAELIWLRHLLEGEAASRQLVRTIASYEALLADGAQCAQQIAAALAIAPPDAAVLSEITAFLADACRHHRIASAATPLPAAVASTWAVLQRWADKGEDAAGRRRLDRLRHDFDAAEQMLAPALADGAAQRRRVSRLEAAAVVAGDRFAALSGQRDALARQREALDATIAGQRRELAAAQAATDSLAGQLDAERERSRIAVADAKLRRAQVEGLSAQVGTLVEELAAARDALALREARLIDQEAERDAERRAARLGAATAAAALAAQQRQTQATSTALDDARNRLAELATRLRAQDEDARARAADLAWLGEVTASIAAAPRWWTMLPEAARRRRLHARLARKGLFDADGYLARYPDVAAAGIDPLWHCIRHGLAERRAR